MAQTPQTKIIYHEDIETLKEMKIFTNKLFPNKSQPTKN